MTVGSAALRQKIAVRRRVMERSSLECDMVFLVLWLRLQS